MKSFQTRTVIFIFLAIAFVGASIYFDPAIQWHRGVLLFYTTLLGQLFRTYCLN